MKWSAVVAMCSLVSIVVAENPKPGVVPTLREWTGGVGSVQITEKTAICVDKGHDKALRSTVKILQEDLKEVAGFSPGVRTADPRPGDIVLRLTGADGKLGSEGYRFETADSIVISAPTPKGVFYGTRSLLQMLILDGNRAIPRGSAIDWPDHAVRGLVLDVGRKFFTTSFLRRYMKFMGFYKMNELQLHVNDNGFIGRDGDTTYAAFRLQSKRHPGLTAKDGSYSKRDIVGLQDLGDQYGVTITPEIDAPAHALAFIRYRPNLVSPKYPKDHLDLANPDTQKLINEVWEEFIPWFRADYMHIGADEYSSDPASHADYKRYINQTAALIKSKGKKVRMWGGLKVGGGAEGVDRDIVVNLWYPGYHDPIDAVKEGYKLINTHDGYLYIVPFAGYYYQFLNTKFLYETWLPNDFGGGKAFPYGDPNILGGMFAVWNDMGGYPYTEDDVHELVLPAMPTVAEKLWSGPSQGKRTYAVFESNFRKLGDGPGVQFGAPPVVVRKGNMANGAKATGSEGNGGSFGASAIVDSRPPTRWIVDGKKPQWVTVDLGEVKEIGRYTIRWAPHQYAKRFTLSSSTDGEDWSVITMAFDGKDGVFDHAIASRKARYIKLELLEPGKEKQYSIFEFEVYPK